MMECIVPPHVIVKDTGTPKGRGVFSCRAIQAGEIIEESPVVLVGAPFSDLPEDVKKIVFNWTVLSGCLPANAIALGYGSLYNHGNPANMRYEADPVKRVLRFTAIRNISEGEELTVNYNAVGGGATWHDDNWFDRMQVARIE